MSTVRLGVRTRLAIKNARSSGEIVVQYPITVFLLQWNLMRDRHRSLVIHSNRGSKNISESSKNRFEMFALNCNYCLKPIDVVLQ